MRPGPIVHPTDFSDGAEPAFLQALEQAARENRELVLVHVLETMSELAARKCMDVLLDRAKARGLVATDVVIERLVAEEIAKTVRAVGADVVVMGTHGRSRVMRLLMGSVAARVLELAPCPVVTVPRV